MEGHRADSRPQPVRDLLVPTQRVEVCEAPESCHPVIYLGKEAIGQRNVRRLVELELSLRLVGYYIGVLLSLGSR